jgi:hypothetical protein
VGTIDERIEGLCSCKSYTKRPKRQTDISLVHLCRIASEHRCSSLCATGCMLSIPSLHPPTVSPCAGNYIWVGDDTLSHRSCLYCGLWWHQTQGCRDGLDPLVLHCNSGSRDCHRYCSLYFGHPTHLGLENRFQKQNDTYWAQQHPPDVSSSIMMSELRTNLSVQIDTNSYLVPSHHSS